MRFGCDDAATLLAARYPPYALEGTLKPVFFLGATNRQQEQQVGRGFFHEAAHARRRKVEGSTTPARVGLVWD